MSNRTYYQPEIIDMAREKGLLKKDEQALKKPIAKVKKNKKKNYTSFANFIFKLLRTTSIEGDKMGISQKAMTVFNDLVVDKLENIACEAGRVANYAKRNTLTSRDIQTAVRLLIPGELAIHANIEGTKALDQYHNNKD